MKKLWLNILWTILKRIIGNDGLMKDVAEFVSAAFRTDLPGPEKRELVRKELADVGHDLAAIGGSLINLAIEAAVALAKARAEGK
jgi:hypothetical protein